MSAVNLPVITDSFEHYMTQINRYDLLDREQEVALASRYRIDNDLDAAHSLICANLRFVVKIANEYRRYGLRQLDLVQEGNIGLMMAVNKFDPDRGIRLISYAVWWIRAYIQNFIMRSWSMVKIGGSRAQKKLFFKLKQTQAQMRSLTGSAPTADMADKLEVSEKDIEEMAVMMSGRDTSLNVELFAGEDYTLLDRLVDQRINQEEELANKQESQLLKEQVQQAMQVLNERERRIVQKRILDEDTTTLQSLADDYNISRERVRQIEQNALRKVKEAFCPTN
jgi:RNA polymerase sigma-32 factor